MKVLPKDGICPHCGCTQMDKLSDGDLVHCPDCGKRTHIDTLWWMSDTRHKDYIERLRANLRNLGITQVEFARKVGCSTSHINQVFNGRNHYISKRIWEVARRYVIYEWENGRFPSNGD